MQSNHFNILPKSSFFFSVNENQFRGNKLSLLKIDMHGIEFNFI